MGLRVGYSYYYGGASSPPPDWFVSEMKTYLEQFLPSYYSAYLGADVTIEEAPFAYISQKPPGQDWISYFRGLRDQVTAGYDAMFAATDLPYSEVSPGTFTAGEDFYLLHPNFGWVAMANWDHVLELGIREGPASYAYLPWYAMQLGSPQNIGINCLATVGHEITHFVLLETRGLDVSAAIDGGNLAGLALLDANLDAVDTRPDDTSSYRYAVQRVTTALPCSAALGAYGCSMGSTIFTPRFF